MTPSMETTDSTPGSTLTIPLDDVDYYLERVRREFRSAKSAQTVEVARVHLGFAAHYLRSVSLAVERRLLDGGGG